MTTSLAAAMIGAIRLAAFGVRVLVDLPG